MQGFSPLIYIPNSLIWVTRLVYFMLSLWRLLWKLSRKCNATYSAIVKQLHEHCIPICHSNYSNFKLCHMYVGNQIILIWQCVVCTSCISSSLIWILMTNFSINEDVYETQIRIRTRTQTFRNFKMFKQGNLV